MFRLPDRWDSAGERPPSQTNYRRDAYFEEISTAKILTQGKVKPLQEQHVSDPSMHTHSTACSCQQQAVGGAFFRGQLEKQAGGGLTLQTDECYPNGELRSVKWTPIATTPPSGFRLRAASMQASSRQMARAQTTGVSAVNQQTKQIHERNYCGNIRGISEQKLPCKGISWKLHKITISVKYKSRHLEFIAVHPTPSLQRDLVARTQVEAGGGDLIWHILSHGTGHQKEKCNESVAQLRRLRVPVTNPMLTGTGWGRVILLSKANSLFLKIWMFGELGAVRGSNSMCLHCDGINSMG